MSLLLAFQGAPPAAEAETLAPLSVRLGYRGYSRVLAYVWNPARDVDVAAPVAESTYASLLVRLPYRNLGRNRYLWNQAQDVLPPFDLPSFLAKPQYKQLGRNLRLLWNQALDVDVAPAQESTYQQFLVTRSLASLLRGNQALLHATAQDFDAPVEADTWQHFLIRLDLTSRLRGALQARLFLMNNAPQDFDAPPADVTSATYIPTFRTRRGR